MHCYVYNITFIFSSIAGQSFNLCCVALVCVSWHNITKLVIISLFISSKHSEWVSLNKLGLNCGTWQQILSVATFNNRTKFISYFQNEVMGSMMELFLCIIWPCWGEEYMVMNDKNNTHTHAHTHIHAHTFCYC